MAMRRRPPVVALIAALVVVLELGSDGGGGVMGNLVFRVENKFKLAGKNRTRREMKLHDIERQRRFLSVVDLNLGGDGHPSSTEMYFAKIGLGTPSKDFYVHVDTGSDTLWLNCAPCDNCPTSTKMIEKLNPFDPTKSNTSKPVLCDDPICDAANDYVTAAAGCKFSDRCPFEITYGDKSAARGYMLDDFIQLSQVTGDLQTSALRSRVKFGCASNQLGNLNVSNQVTNIDGLIGLGSGNSSILSQLAAAGKVKKRFAHCLSMEDGGGIFAIGNVVSTKIKTTPLVPVPTFYQVFLKKIDVDGEILQHPADLFEPGDNKGVIVDSGTTMATIPGIIYDQIITKINKRQPGIKFKTKHKDEADSCFPYTKNIDDKFPIVTFHFEDSLTLPVYPHDYLFVDEDDDYCLGFQKDPNPPTQGSFTLLGDTVLQNRLVVYDLENMTVGWTEHDCSSSNIKVKDDISGTEYSVTPHNIS